MKSSMLFECPPKFSGTSQLNDDNDGTAKIMNKLVISGAPGYFMTLLMKMTRRSSTSLIVFDSSFRVHLVLLAM